jgi:hypothetical protein
MIWPRYCAPLLPVESSAGTSIGRNPDDFKTFHCSIHFRASASAAAHAVSRSIMRCASAIRLTWTKLGHAPRYRARMTTHRVLLVSVLAVSSLACSSWSTSTDVGDLTTKPFVGRGFSFDVPKDWSVDEKDADALKVSHHNFMALIVLMPLGSTQRCNEDSSRKELADLAAAQPLTELKGIAAAEEPLTWSGVRATALRANLSGAGTEYLLERHSWCGLTIAGAPVRGELIVLPQGRADVFATHIKPFHRLVSTLKVKDWQLPPLAAAQPAGSAEPAAVPR